MKNEINAVLENMTTATPEPEDYTGEDGLLYCGRCRKPKEAYFAPDKAAIFGRDRHPAECDCQRAARALWPIPEYFSVADRIRRVAGRVPRQAGTVH